MVLWKRVCDCSFISGRFFACSTHTLALKIISKSSRDKEKQQQFMYFVNDGIYGSFMFLKLDHSTLIPSFFKVSIFIMELCMGSVILLP